MLATYDFCEGGALSGAPLLIVPAQDYSRDTFDIIARSRYANTQVVQLVGPREWDDAYLSDLARQLACAPQTEDLTFKVDRGIFSPNWPYGSESMYLSVDCSILFDNLGTPKEFQQRLNDEIAMLPAIDEVLVRTDQPVSYQHLDILAVELGCNQLFFTGSDKVQVCKLLSRCTTNWRLG